MLTLYGANSKLVFSDYGLNLLHVLDVMDQSPFFMQTM